MKMLNVNLLTVFVIVVCCLVDPTTQQQASTFECGRRSRSPPRISNGYDAYPGEYPWMARIEIRNQYNPFICGGTLISDRHVLTAAHCLGDNGHYITFQSLSITLGVTDISEPGHRQTFGWKRIVTYTDWTLLENDIAIITLSKSVNLTDYVQPACLPFEDDSDHVYESVSLTGWGIYDDTNTYSLVLKSYNEYVIPWPKCQQTASEIGDFSDDNIICSGLSSGRYYHGDDGGPMNYLQWDCDRWFVIGVAGRGESFSNETQQIKPNMNLFSRVRAHLDFIRRHTGVASPNDCSSGRTTGSAVDTTTHEIKTTTSNAETTTASPTTSATPSTRQDSTTEASRTTTPSATTATTSPKTNPPTTTTTTSTTSTTTTTNTPMTFDCADKTDGNYPASNSICSSNFYMCSNGNAYLFNCASDLVYHEELRVCDWPSNVAGCH